MSEIKNQILNAIRDKVSQLIYYDRKEDEDLPRGAIEQAASDGLVSIDEMVDVFRTDLTRAVFSDRS